MSFVGPVLSDNLYQCDITGEPVEIKQRRMDQGVEKRDQQKVNQNPPNEVVDGNMDCACYSEMIGCTRLAIGCRVGP